LRHSAKLVASAQMSIARVAATPARSPFANVPPGSEPGCATKAASAYGSTVHRLRTTGCSDLHQGVMLG